MVRVRLHTMVAGALNAVVSVPPSVTAARPRYEQPSFDNNVNCLQGLDDAVTELRQTNTSVAGLFVWHGWDTGDTFDVWAAANQNGSMKELKILADASH